MEPEKQIELIPVDEFRGRGRDGRGGRGGRRGRGRGRGHAEKEIQNLLKKKS